MTDWIAICVSIVALIVSLKAYQSGLPRLRLEATGPAIIVDALEESGGPLAIGITVTLTNDGGTAVNIDRAYLQGENIYGAIKEGPRTFPMRIEGRGGSLRWQFDANDLKNQLRDKIRSELRDPSAPLFVRATVEYGSKVKRSNTLQINAPGDARPRPPTRPQRLRRFVRSWTRPKPFIAGWHRVSLEDLEARIVPLEIVNPDRGTSRPCQLVVMVQHADGTSELWKSFRPIDVPRIRGRRSTELAVSYVDDSDASASDQFWWALRNQAGVTGQMVAAKRISEVPGLIAHLKSRPLQQENGDKK
ncbi:hypothetical protein ABQF33_03075 [Mycolicibacterium sp. XJ2]